MSMYRCRVLAGTLIAGAVIAAAPAASTFAADAGPVVPPSVGMAPAQSSPPVGDDPSSTTVVDAAAPNTASPAARRSDSGAAGTAVFVLALLGVVVIGAIIAIEFRGRRSR